MMTRRLRRFLRYPVIATIVMVPGILPLVAGRDGVACCVVAGGQETKAAAQGARSITLIVDGMMKSRSGAT